MCCCEKPIINGQEGYRWNNPSGPAGVYPVNPPALQDGDVLLLDLPGRCGGSDSHSHHYRLVNNIGPTLLVRHGGGDRRVRLSGPVKNILLAMSETDAYWLLNAIYHANNEGQRQGQSEATQTWRRAAAEKRIRTRKQRGSDRVKVWLEHESITTPGAIPQLSAY